MSVIVNPKSGESSCALYEIKVNEIKAEPEDARVSSVAFNRRWPGHQRGIEQTEIAWFLEISTDEPIRFEIRPKEPFESVVIRPRSLGIVPEIQNGVIRFTLERPAYFTLEPYGRHRALHLFVDPPARYNICLEDPNFLFFGPGDHEVGELRLLSGQTLYIAEGAVVYGKIIVSDANNVRILGRGILDNSRERERILYPYNAEENEVAVNNAVRGHTIRVEYCENIEIDGITIRDSLCYTIRPLCCRNVRISHVKVIGNWRYNSDGFDMHNCEDIQIENCFLRTYDDSICVKGIDFYTEPGVDVEQFAWEQMHRNGEVYDCFRNVCVRGCTIWNDWGKALEIGAETRAEEICDVIFEDCEIIHVTGPVLDCCNVDYADIHDIIYRNINVEYDDQIPEMQIQKRDSESYFQVHPDYTPPLCCVNTMYHPEYSAGGKRRGQCRNIIFQNIYLWGRQPPILQFDGYNDTYQTRDITVQSIWWNGKLLNDFPPEYLHCNEYTTNIRYMPKVDPNTGVRKYSVVTTGQIKESDVVRFWNPKGVGKRVLFLGNSITLHGRKPEIGWLGEWGMAASSPEHDYVHLLMKRIRVRDPDAAFCICQAANWERSYKNGVETYESYEQARNFRADLIVIRLVENCPQEGFEPKSFCKELKAFVSYLDKEGTAKVLVTTGFWRHPADEALLAYARANNYPCVELGDLGEQDEMKAIGLFEHTDVANHPGDLGMQKIAERIIETLQQMEF